MVSVSGAGLGWGYSIGTLRCFRVILGQEFWVAGNSPQLSPCVNVPLAQNPSAAGLLYGISVGRNTSMNLSSRQNMTEL